MLLPVQPHRGTQEARVQRAGRSPVRARPVRAAIPLVLAGLLVAGLLGACSGETQARDFRPIVRPVVALAPDAVPNTELKPWFVVEPALGGVEVVQALRTEVKPDPGGRATQGLLKLFGRDKKVLEASPPVGANRLDRIRLRLWIPRYDALQVQWMRDGAVRGEIGIPLFPTPAPVDYTIELPASADRDFDRLVFRVPGEGPVALGHIELFEIRSEHRLPRPGEAPEFVRVGDDTRPSWGLTGSRPLQITFPAPADGVLVASAGIPATLRLAGDTPILTVRVLGQPGGIRLHRYPLIETDEAPRGWVPIRVPLEPEVGGSTTVRFSLETTSPIDAVCAITQPQVVSFDEDAPTVLFITSDTHRGDSVGFANSGVPVTTPVLDDLARRGVVFDEAFSATNVTLPSHIAMFTGMTLRETRILDNTEALGANARTLAEAFSESGWATVAAVSASHLGPEWSGLGQGFDRMAVCRPSKRSAGETLAYLERWIPDYRGRPLFVWLHLFDAHSPYRPPPPFNASAWDTSQDPYDPALPEPDPTTVPQHLPKLRNLDFVVALYRGEVNYLDSELARLLGRARFRDAIVAFTADHGESFGSHGVYWDHGGIYRDRTHVPLLIKGPGAPAGARIARRVSNTDVGRTLLDLAGLAGVDYPGSNLLASGASKPSEEPVFAISCFGFSASIAEGDDLLILHLASHKLHARSAEGQREKHAVELFDIAADPECSENLARARPERTKELRRKLVAWLRAGVALPWKSTPIGNLEVLENLTALGYARGSELTYDAELFPTACDCAGCAEFEP